MAYFASTRSHRAKFITKCWGPCDVGAKDSGKCFAREHHNLSIPSSSRHRNMGRSSSNSAVHAIASSNGCGSGDIGRDDAGVCSSSSHVGLGCCCRSTNGYRELVVGTRRDTPDLMNQSINRRRGRTIGSIRQAPDHQEAQEKMTPNPIKTRAARKKPDFWPMPPFSETAAR